ncbi:pickpocket protein 19-like [Nasonia vitripennis]|uniref:Uncharacterized protein n=1 Tax=Nasonia vitripennis TaxID=7425 RepID=A0A7M7IVZ5_NASVI|nr:pickpocket protein 19-like [Nasonia vitripennis]
MNRNKQIHHSDFYVKKNALWHFPTDTPKTDDEFKSRFKRPNVKKKKKIRKLPKRLENPVEMWKYFISHTSLHGLKYSQDENLYRIERVIWVLLFIAGAYSTVRVIFELYGNFQAKQTNIFIDDLNHDIFHISFPSVTICPSSRVDWEEATKIASTLIPATNKKATNTFFEILANMSNVKIANLDRLNVSINDDELEYLTRINISDVLFKVLPKCDKIIFNCSWSYVTVNCCEIFEVQRTGYGFCYTFNSLTSVGKLPEEPRNAHAYGVRSGLRFVTQNNFQYPPRHSNNDKINSVFMISHPKAMFPTKGRYVASGRRYNVDLKFTTAISSNEVLELENDENPPCKHENGSYQFVNCLSTCKRNYIQKLCGCTPSFFFPMADNSSRECNIQDLQCLAKERKEINEVHFSLAGEQPHVIKTMCNCPPECEYCNYDDYVIGTPYYKPDAIMLDVHYDGPTGVRYKRVIRVSRLDMMVQLGGIFGLFLGGSLLTILEFLYCFVVGLTLYVYQRLVCNKRKKDSLKIQNIINVTSYSNEKRIYPLLDFPPRVLNRKKPKF